MSIAKLCIALWGLFFVSVSAQAQNWKFNSTSDDSIVEQRHETGSVVVGDKLYVLGGRSNRPSQVFDASENRWSTIAPMPMELHHFQPVALNGYIYVIGAFTCCFPDEPTISDIYRLDISNNTWEVVGELPSDRLRGSAGAAAHNNKIYLIGGNTKGHSGGAVPWFDEYNPATGEWKTLADAPSARDHFSAAIVAGKLVAAAGRETTTRSFGGMISETDTYDFSSNTWTSSAHIPTPRAGTMIGVHDNRLIVIGGETDTQVEAHSEVEVFDVRTDKWESLPDLQVGRHGGAGGVINNILHAITGNTKRGGNAEVTTHETLQLSDENAIVSTDSDGDGLTDSEEQDIGTDPLVDDTDADGLKDSEEVSLGTNPLEVDSDFDTISDIDELQLYNTNPLNADSDGDSLNDQDELQIYFTNPQITDSDNDGLSDDVEVLVFNSNPNEWDTDGDGLSDATEAAEGSNLIDTDDDNDGIFNNTEGVEDPDADGLPNYLDADSDNDGIPDVVENGGTDINNDGLPDNAEQFNLTSSNALLDTDQDGVANIFDLDSDQDGITDYVESGQQGVSTSGRYTLEIFSDLDQNGWHDDSSALIDTDADTVADYLDLDSNNNGIFDVVEIGQPDANNDGTLDVFVDLNSDGFDDSLASLNITVEIVDMNNVPDGAPSETITSAKSSGGGALPLTLPLFVSLLVLLRRMNTRSATSTC